MKSEDHRSYFRKHMQDFEETKGKQMAQVKKWKQGTGDANYKGCDFEM